MVLMIPAVLICRISPSPDPSPESAMTNTLPAASTVRLVGKLTGADTAGRPSPSSPPEPYIPLPATVETIPDAPILAMRLLAVSVISKVPSRSTVTLLGFRNWAEIAGVPSPAGDPLPATVMIKPEDVISRMRLLLISAMNRLPARSEATRTVFPS